MRIIPAIDILNGKCVRLSQGDYNAKQTYSESPLDMAKSFEDAGLKCLHLVDLDGARSGGIVNVSILKELAARTSLKIDFGGGIKSDRDLALAFDCGAAQANVGSLALRQPAIFLRWLERYGPDKIILGADCRNRLVAASGWLEESTVDIVDYIREYVRQGVSQVVCTDIGRDGMLRGPALLLYKEILRSVDACLTASGGISSMADLHALKRAGCRAAIVGKAIYEGKVTLEQLRELC